MIGFSQRRLLTRTCLLTGQLNASVPLHGHHCLPHVSLIDLSFTRLSPSISRTVTMNRLLQIPSRTSSINRRVTLHRGVIRFKSDQSSDAIKRPVQKLVLPEPDDPRPRWGVTVNKISSFVIIPCACLSPSCTTPGFWLLTCMFPTLQPPLFTQSSLQTLGTMSIYLVL